MIKTFVYGGALTACLALNGFAGQALADTMAESPLNTTTQSKLADDTVNNIASTFVCAIEAVKSLQPHRMGTAITGETARVIGVKFGNMDHIGKTEATTLIVVPKNGTPFSIIAAVVDNKGSGGSFRHNFTIRTMQDNGVQSYKNGPKGSALFTQAYNQVSAVAKAMEKCLGPTNKPQQKKNDHPSEHPFHNLHSPKGNVLAMQPSSKWSGPSRTEMLGGTGILVTDLSCK